MNKKKKKKRIKGGKKEEKRSDRRQKKNGERKREMGDTGKGHDDKLRGDVTGLGDLWNNILEKTFLGEWQLCINNEKYISIYMTIS